MSEPAEDALHMPQGDTADLARVWVVAILAGVLIAMIGIVAWAGGGPRGVHRSDRAFAQATSGAKPNAPGTISVEAPPWKSDEAIDSLEETGKPCSGCHDNEELVANPERRELDTHDDIVLHHDEEHRWCLDCHDAQDRDKLRLASGKLIDFTESYRLCGQCHGDKYRDWRAGIHGRRTGYWDSTRGDKRYLLCVHCHYAHAPAFKPIGPRPPPVRPEALK